MDRKYTTMTDFGEVISASTIPVATVNATVDGYVQDCPRYRLAIALRADGSGWECMYEGGGDWSGISDDNLSDVLTLGRLDDSNTTDSERLIEGAEIIEGVARTCRDLSEGRNDELDALVEWLEGRAADARETAESLGDDDYEV